MLICEDCKDKFFRVVLVSKIWKVLNDFFVVLKMTVNQLTRYENIKL